MRSLCAAIYLIILIFCFCLWCGYEIASATDRLSAAAHRAVTEENLPTLVSLWEKERGFISLSANRRLVMDAEKALSLMQTHISDTDLTLFYSARTAFLHALQTIKSSYSISFASII